MKRILSVLLVFISINVLGQELNSIESVYQKILDDDEFLFQTNEPNFKCDSIIYESYKNDSILNLTFKGKKLYKFYEVAGFRKNPRFIFVSKEDGNKINIKVMLLYNRERIVGCLYTDIVEYTCSIKMKKNVYIIKNTKIRSSTRTSYILDHNIY